MKYGHFVIFAALANKETGEHKKVATLPLPINVYKFYAKTEPFRRMASTVFRYAFWLSVPFFLAML